MKTTEQDKLNQLKKDQGKCQNLLRLGVIGGGQLGSLLCSAAKKLKVKTVVLSDDKDGPAQHFCDQFIYSKYDDNAKVKEFINKVDVVTYEFENIPVDFLNKFRKRKKYYQILK